MIPDFFSLERSAFQGLASAGPCLLVVSLSPGELTESKLKRGHLSQDICIFIGSLGALIELPGP